MRKGVKERGQSELIGSLLALNVERQPDDHRLLAGR
jgi:hypothetical protein